ncbi:family 16 glycosylhydrolase [Belnapia rosea]|uniref:family 16 glycosylhydrolase n=1 Tax=Belnapia rosea TaxID=938405 RepID=UPI000881D595|nr:family 16 glycosylhydrolase [Belnapia rosea]SDB71468.1 Glycosyl hydrolases family 16 [Belnapia rosea]
MATTVAALPPLASTNFDWQSADFSYLANNTGQGFGTGSPLELHAAGWDFSWLPDNLPPKISLGVTFYVPNLPDILTGGGVDANIDTSKGWRETFDHGPGLLSRVWGEGVDFSVPGQVTIHRTAADGDSGMMVPPTGASARSGYGLFSWTLNMTGRIGVYADVWPSTDKWPGPELDMIEFTPEGRAYSTIHSKGEDGTAGGLNAFQAYEMAGFDATKTHTSSMLWQPGRLTGYVDGHQTWSTTEHVPLDYAHGGQKLALGIGVQTSWNAQYQSGDNHITIHDASWSPIG